MEAEGFADSGAVATCVAQIRLTHWNAFLLTSTVRRHCQSARQDNILDAPGVAFLDNLETSIEWRVRTAAVDIHKCLARRFWFQLVLLPLFFLISSLSFSSFPLSSVPAISTKTMRRDFVQLLVSSSKLSTSSKALGGWGS